MSQRVIEREELESIVTAHELWLKSGEAFGKRASLGLSDLREQTLDNRLLRDADFKGANLSRSSLRGASLDGAIFEKANLQSTNLSGSTLRRANLLKADLQQAVLSEAKLEGANLKGANLRRAVLTNCILDEAELSGTVLWESNLQNASLKDVKSLTSGQLAGALVPNATLPSAIAAFEGVKILTESLRRANRLLLTILLSCLYSWIAIATTIDVHLLTNSASWPLPILGADIPVVAFYIVTPMLLLCLYAYFHVYMQGSWEKLADLPAVFPDGSRADQKVDLWLVMGLIPATRKSLGAANTPVRRIQKVIAIALSWYLVPITVIGFWERYLTRHDWPGTVVHIVVLALVAGFGLYTYRLSKDTLRLRCRVSFVWRKFWGDSRTLKRTAFAIGVFLLYAVSFGAIEGVVTPVSSRVEPFVPVRIETVVPGASGVRLWVPRVLRTIGMHPFADFEGVEVSGKSDDWSGGDSQRHRTQGARLEKRNLTYGNASRASLVNADLSYADLEGIVLTESDLRGARLYRANLQYAHLIAALGGKADMRYANLDHANLTAADLRFANLFKANCSGCILANALLEGADLRGADLTNAWQVTSVQLTAAVMDSTTQLPYYLKDSVDVGQSPTPHQ